MRKLAAILIAGAALLGVAPSAGAQHGVFFFCEIQPFSYHVDGSSYLANNGRYEYMVTGVTTLTGSDCPVHGQAATFREHGLVFNLFPFTLVAQGSWQAQIDLNNNGTVDASVNGTVTLFGPSFLGQFEQIAGAEGPTFEMGLDQLAAIDFTSPHHQPLVSLDTLQGGIGGFIHVGH